MKFSYHTSQHYWRNLLTLLTLVALTVTVIVWFLPRKESINFHYDVGKPWMYNSFIAKFDFPVYKTDEIIKHEQDSIIETFQPYYNYNVKVEKAQLAKFINDYGHGIPGLPANISSIIVDRLHRLYQAGIMGTPDYNAMAKDTTRLVRVITGKDVEVSTIGCFYSTLTAYEQLFQDQTLALYRTQLQRCNLTNYIEPNMSYDKERSQTERDDMLSSIPIASGMVISGQKVIDHGDIVDEYTYRVLNSFHKEMQRRISDSNQWVRILSGQAIYVLMLVLLFTVYLRLFRKDYFEKPRSIAMLYALITIFPVLISVIMEHSWFSVYILPVCLVPIFIRTFLDSRTAFVTHVTMVLICAAAVRYQYEFVIMQIISGIVAINSLRELSSRAQVFKTAILVTLSYCVVYFAMQLMQNNWIDSIDIDIYYHFIVNGVLLLLSYPLMYLIEKTFGFTSNVTLFELSNTNRGLLREMSEIAPGTFQHSITVANLAAEIANRIGANSLLVRTGGLYHDIGKMKNPVFFTENQAGKNPHDNMKYEDSAKIIISHIADGIKMAEQNNLPQFIKDFIPTHQGRGLTKYFYIKYKNEHPDEDVDPEPFTYPGPNPFTREQAILMMADAVEAASRSLKEYTEETISQLVDNIIDSQVEAGYFKECPITFRDIAQAKQVLIERLKAIYHTRVKYPTLVKKEGEAETDKKANGTQPQ